MKLPAARFLVIFVLFLSLLGFGWLYWSSRPPIPASRAVLPVLAMQGDILQPILPLQPISGLDPERVALGAKLFRDTRLSADLSLACVSCHDLGKGGVDGRQFSVGVGGALGGINAPTVFNSGYSLAQFWDGRAATLEEQAAGPIQNPIEMAASWPQVLARLAQDSELKIAFKQNYPDGLTANNVLNAIATFERSLVTVNSRFDRYLRGEKDVLTELEIDGYRRFREYGCTSCHQGVLVGGNMYQKFGVLGDYFAGRAITKDDLGRFNVTQREEDRHVFKVPGLRNVALTAPYFHDGSARTLDQAVMVMGRYQLGRDLSTEDVGAIVAFLNTLSGELPVEARP